MNPDWLKTVRALQAISQTGLHFATDDFDRERYQQVGRIAADMLADRSSFSAKDFIELNRAEFGYATPKVDVRGIVFREDKLLLVREVMDAGRWTPPGGWADVNESASEATVREVREESGFDTQARKLLAVYDRELQGHRPPFPFHIYKLFFLCEITGGEPRPNREASEIAFFGQDELPELSTSRITAAQLHRFFDHRLHPDWPTDFD